MPEVIVIGGGVIGLSLAYELAGQGVAVEVLDREISNVANPRNNNFVP